MKTLKILLVDDDLKSSMYLKHFLKQENFDVYYAGNGQIAINQYPTVRPDLIVLDINMPVMDGFEVAKQIRAIDKKVLIFFLSDRQDKEDRIKGFELKANDYLPKPFFPEELVARIRERFSLNKTSNEIEDEIYTFGQCTFNMNTYQIAIPPQTVETLTTRQSEIMQLLCINKNKIVSRDTLLEAVWGNSSYNNSLALNVQITYIRRILKKAGDVEIRSIMKRGYMLTER